MFLNAIASKSQTEDDLGQIYISNLIKIGDSVLNNTKFGLDKNINYLSYFKSKILLRFYNNLCVTDYISNTKLNNN